MRLVGGGLLWAPERVRLGLSHVTAPWAPRARAASPTETEGPAQPDVHPVLSSAGRGLRLTVWNQATCPQTDLVARGGDRRGTEPGGTRVKNGQPGPSLTHTGEGPRGMWGQGQRSHGRVTSPSDCRCPAQCRSAGPTCPWGEREPCRAQELGWGVQEEAAPTPRSVTHLGLGVGG